MSPNLSTSQLLNYLQCPRRFWLEQYHPEHEGDVSAMDAALDADEAAEANARNFVTGDHVKAVSGRLGLRSAIAQTAKFLEPGAIVLDGTFEHEGISTQIDVLDWSDDSHSAITVTAAAQLTEHHVHECAIQAWVMRGRELPEHRYIVAVSNTDRTSGEEFETRFSFIDVTERVSGELTRIDSIVPEARILHAALDQPPATTGIQCHTGYACPFLAYCEQR